MLRRKPGLMVKFRVVVLAMLVSGCSGGLPIPDMLKPTPVEQDKVTLSAGHSVPVPVGYCTRSTLKQGDTRHSLIGFSGCAMYGRNGIGDILLTVRRSGNEDQTTSPDVLRALARDHKVEVSSVSGNVTFAKLSKASGKSFSGYQTQFWRAVQNRENHLIMATLLIPDGQKISQSRAKRVLLNLMDTVSLNQESTRVEQAAMDQPAMLRPRARP